MLFTCKKRLGWPPRRFFYPIPIRVSAACWWMHRGAVIGRGFTQQAGGPHAEVMALRDAAAQGHSTQGATAYVTLEPCAHHGRTGPCCEALIAAGVAQVVGALTDPNPQVAGQGFARLQAAGVAVEAGPGAAASRALNIGFLAAWSGAARGCG